MIETATTTKTTKTKKAKAKATAAAPRVLKTKIAVSELNLRKAATRLLTAQGVRRVNFAHPPACIPPHGIC